ncbi:MAG: hypothetical protein ACM3L5_00590 [Candidatus Saccharibacteria bacterium]
MLLVSAALATFLRIMFQGLIPAGTDSGVGESAIVKAGLLIPAFALYALLVFIVFGYIFLLIERSLPASSGIQRGLLYGSAMALVWVAYLFEPVPLGANTPFPDILAYPIADGTAMIVFGLLLGRLVATKGPSQNVISIRPLAPLLAIAGFVVLFRLIAYNIFKIYSLYEARALDTMLWVLVTAVIIGIAYLLLRPGLPAATPWGKAITYGLVVFGVSITLINFFVPLALDINIVDLALRTAMDVVAVVLGTYAGERIGQSSDVKR